MSKPVQKANPVVTERQLPHSLEAERSILGAILLNNQSLHDAIDKITVGDFFFPQHLRIFSHMLKLQEKNEAIDSVTLMDSLNQDGELESVGGASYLSQLADGLPRVTNVEHYAKMVKEKSVLRQMIHEAESIQSKAFDGALDSWKIADAAAQAFSTLAQVSGSTSVSTRKEASLNLLARLDAQQDSKILTGITGLDEILGGFMPGELIVYTAETGVGKTFLALQTAKKSCLAGEHGLYCSGEMLAAHLMSRELVSETKVPSWKMRRPSQLTHEDFSMLTRAAANECPHCEILDGELTLPNIRSASRSAADRGKFKFLIVDYDELVEVSGGDGEWDEQRTLTREMKNMGMRLRAPVIMISQLRKALNDQQREFPRLSDLYGSGAKSKHASIVIFVDRPYVQKLEGDETEAKLFVLKSRDGRQGMVNALFNIHTFRFEQAPPSDDPFPSEPRSRRKNRDKNDD